MRIENLEVGKKKALFAPDRKTCYTEKLILTRSGCLTNKGNRRENRCHLFDFMVRPAGFEPAAYGLEVRCSIQLSYGRSGVR